MAPYTEPYDVADYLDSDAMIAAYLTESLEDNDPQEIVQALSDVARAKGGIAQLSRDTGIPEDELAKTLNATGNPDLSTLLKIVHAFGVRISFSSSTQEPVAA